MFDFKAAIAARPSGETTTNLMAAYGNPEGPGAGPSKQGGAWFEPSPAWKKDNLVKVNLSDLPGFPQYPGATITGVTVHRVVAPILVATWAELHRRGLTGKLRTFNGSFAARHMGHDRTRPLSVHAFGAALDLDAAWNGYGSPLSRMQMDREVVRCFEECGWTWGGRWSSPYEDGMHYQWTDPLRGTPVAEWQDALGRSVAPTPAPPAAATVPLYLYSQNRDPNGTLRPDWTSIAVDPSGRVLLGADKHPRTVYMPPELAAAKGLK